MMTNTIRRFRWFWAWEDDHEEVWLSEMARQGYHLARTPGPGVYTFIIGEPCECVYRLDFRANPRESLEDYRQLFTDAGWELVGVMSGWHYWRKKPILGEPAEIFTDVSSKVAKYRRLMGFLGAMAVMLLAIWISSFDRPHGRMITVIYAAILALYGVGLTRLAIRVRQLKRQSP